MDRALFLKTLAALFAIMNPIANLPVFLSLTTGYGAGERRKVALTVTAGLIIGAIVVALAGKGILALFGISIEDFRLAGGFLILLIALNLVSGHQSSSHGGTAKEQAHQSFQENPAIYPLTVPILLGPGTISTLIIFRDQVHSLPQDIAYGAAIVVAIALISVTLLAATALDRLLGQTATSIMSRLMGMVLAAIAMEMMITSLKVMLPGLAS